MSDADLPAGERRPDIQGLRALAVTAVLLFHLWPGLVPGGYVGVDVFFVVSGYLITGQLFRELSATGRVRVLDFYARRIRRLIPAAFFVLAVTLVAMLLLLPMLVWRTNLADMAAASTYVLNWHLAWTNTDYLAAAETPSMVQHYWSLSVEEQFYVVWPLLLVTGAWCGSRLLHVSRRASTVVVLVVVFTLSLTRSVVETQVQPQVAFFATRDRAWEFALGGLVALLAPTLLSPRGPAWPASRVSAWWSRPAWSSPAARRSPDTSPSSRQARPPSPWRPAPRRAEVRRLSRPPGPSCSGSVTTPTPCTSGTGR
jgi:peptidoglycan/LPS O-acetylase OafA/YrhL